LRLDEHPAVELCDDPDATIPQAEPFIELVRSLYVFGE
jgi:hypothetical protein